MRIIKAYPPNIDSIKAVFPIFKGVIFTYNGELYNPDGVHITSALLKHEEIHAAQQKQDDKWWDKYLIDKTFRFAQELAAHKAEFREFRKHNNRELTAQMRYTIAQRLASPLYGRLCTLKEALDYVNT
jgi:hypothetical protein